MANIVLAVKQDRLLMLILQLITVSILLIGHNTSITTAFYVACYEAFFIVSFIFLGNGLNLHKTITANKPLSILFISWLVLSSVSFLQLYFINIDETHRIVSALRFSFILVHVLFFLVLIQYFSVSKFKLSAALKIVPYIGIVIVLTIILLLYIFDTPQLSYTTTSIPFATNVRHLGYILAVCACISGFNVLNASHINKIFWHDVLLFTVNFSCLIWLGGRASLLSIFVAITALFLYQVLTKQWQKFNVLCFTVISLLSIALSTLLSIYPWNGLFRMVGQIEGNLNDISNNRFELWYRAIQAGLERPWFGLGPDAYRFSTNMVAGVQPHNAIIQFFMEWGLLGGGVFLALLLLGMYKCIKRVKTGNSTKLNDGFRHEQLCAILIIITLTVYAMLSGAYYHAQPVYLLLLAFAVFPAAYYRANAKA